MSHELEIDCIDGEQEIGFGEEFWMENYPKLLRYCYFLTRNRWDGDEIAQETFIKALKYEGRQQEVTKALLNKIAYNHWIDLLRKRKNETIEADPDLANEAILYQLDATAETVEILLRNFTPNQAIIFLLKEGFQYQLKEIAAIVDSTEMAVKANLHRAKKRLEKANEERQFHSVDLFWNEEEREWLSDLFYVALKNQDPTILIQSIRSRLITSEAPKLVSDNICTKPTFTPSSTLCMAA